MKYLGGLWIENNGQGQCQCGKENVKLFSVTFPKNVTTVTYNGKTVTAKTHNFGEEWHNCSNCGYAENGRPDGVNCKSKRAFHIGFCRNWVPLNHQSTNGEK